MTRPTTLQKGFTLVELAIVVLVTGLVVGVVVIGSEMVHNTLLRKVVTEVNAIQVAVSTFRVKYDAVPGDISNASMYWPNCDPTPSNCDGNGDGKIDLVDTAPPLQAEELRAWQQLSDEGTIPWQLNGISNGTSPLKLDVNVPRSGFGKNNAGYRLSYSYHVVQANSVQVVNPESRTNFWGSALSAVDAQTIDQKYDDGHPGAGRIRGVNGYNSVTNTVESTCVLSASQFELPLQYITPLTSDVVCALNFIL